MARTQPKNGIKKKAKAASKKVAPVAAKAKSKATSKAPSKGKAAKPLPVRAAELPTRTEPYLADVPGQSVARPVQEGVALATALGKYVYCIIQTSEPLRFGAIGLGAEPSEVHTINYRDLAAVVSDTPMGVHDPTRENVLAHQAVNETVMRKYTVIPMSFGTVFKTREDIVELLRSAYDAFSDVLSKMQNKVEYGLKVLWDRDQVVRELESEEEEVRRLKSEISSQKGSTYFARMQYGRLVDATLQARSEKYVSDIFAALRDVSVASRSNKPIGDKMILNAAFLVAREKEAAFDQRVKDIGSKYDKLTFKYTGPWPPYNFVNIRLKLERAK